MQEKRNGLEIDLDPDYHRHYWRLQRVGWIGLTLIVAAALAGSFGPGLMGRSVTSSKESNLLITYDHFLHYQAPAEIEIEAHPTDTMANSVQLKINRSYIDDIELTRIDPEPESQEGTSDKIIYTFNHPRTGDPVKVSFYFEPTRFGSIPLKVSVDDKSPIAIKQFVYP